jgi:hypothetical protein
MESQASTQIEASFLEDILELGTYCLLELILLVFFPCEDQTAWICLFCKDAQETISHVILDCSFARIFWNSSSWSLDSFFFSNLPIYEWISAVIYPLKKLAILIHET